MHLHGRGAEIAGGWSARRAVIAPWLSGPCQRILFALPDSLTLVAGQSSLRLESYLFTVQAVQAARAHLKPGDGLFAMYNGRRRPPLPVKGLPPPG